eukprot:COSAG02_NODE_651_length_18910_cov_12.561639_17_plen_51_part_00
MVGQQLVPSDDFAVTTMKGEASVRVAVKNRGAPIASAGLRPRGSPKVQLH